MLDFGFFTQTRIGAELFRCYRELAAAQLFRGTTEDLKNFLANG